MDDSHGKEISLQYVTVKVPGQKPRGSRGTQLQQTAIMAPTAGVAPGANGVLNEPITAGIFSLPLSFQLESEILNLIYILS